MVQMRYIFLVSSALICLSWVSVNAAPSPTGPFGDPNKSIGSPVEKGPSKKPSGKGVLPVKTVAPGKEDLKYPNLASSSNASPSKSGIPPPPTKDQLTGCPCYVPAIYAPVCGSDQKVYANKYLLECENTCSQKNLKVTKEGKC